MHEIKFPAHTQARMDAAKTAKTAKTANTAASPASVPPLEDRTPALQGHVEGLDVDARQDILESEGRLTIAYGSLGSPIILQEKVNAALLHHYIPKILDDFYVIANNTDMIVLPNDMYLVTERGLKHVIRCMLNEIQNGSHISSSGDGRYMIQPHKNVVETIHAMNTLRAFGLDHDADFLAGKEGPIAEGLKVRAQEWHSDLGGLGRFLERMDRELLEGEDKELLSEAWAVYNERRYGNDSSTAPESNA